MLSAPSDVRLAIKVNLNVNNESLSFLPSPGLHNRTNLSSCLLPEVGLYSPI